MIQAQPTQHRTRKSRFPNRSQNEVRFINKTQEVYSYVVNHPELNERELADALSHLTAPVVHASLKSLTANGHLIPEKTEERNKRKRPLLKFRAVLEKPYEPSYGTRKNGHRESVMARTPSAKRKTRPARAKATNVSTASKSDEQPFLDSVDGSAIASLTLQTSSGTVRLPLIAARQLYTELKKLFENE